MCIQDIGVVKVDVTKDVLAAFDTSQKVLRIIDKESGMVLLRENIDEDMTIGEFTEKLSTIKKQIVPCQANSK